MKKQNLTIVNLIVICSLTIYSNRIVAQQGRVDSVIHLFNKSIINNKIESVSIGAALDLLSAASLTDSQINQIETTTLRFDSLKYFFESFNIRLVILNRIINTDGGKAISYGKLQIDKMDELSRPELSGIRTTFLSSLRIPFRNTSRLEEGFRYYTQNLNYYKIRNDSSGITLCYFVLAGFYNTSGLIDLAIYNMKKSISYLDTLRQKGTWINHTSNIASFYSKKGDIYESLKYYRLLLKEKTKSPLQNFYSTVGMANILIQANQLDSAAHYINLVKRDTTPYFDVFRAFFLQIESLYNIHTGNLEEAENLLNKCWQLIHKSNIPADAQSGIIIPDYYLAMVRIKQNRFDEATTLLTRDIERLLNNRLEKLRDYKILANLYKKTGKHDKAAEAYSIYIVMQDSLLADQDKFRTFSFEAEQLINEKELSIAKLESQNRISSLFRNFSIGIAALLLLIVGGIYNRFRIKKKANMVLEKTLTDLKSTQAQLIQAEKMASLGELTAGIAHEIQNPLNFVNNFSEVNYELIKEMKNELAIGNEQLAKGEIQTAINSLENVIEVSNVIESNSEKINHHGKRADAIVKSMLQHSRSGESGNKKEPTDINTLADEYFRLAYHGLKAKDKTFNSKMESNFDPYISTINVIPQEIGRVLLNLINNAFYAVQEKKKLHGETYEPVVSVSTKKEGNNLLISVKDNGNGIPQKVLDKIFQPFFTTKPTGQGTGLGLSISYDIVKANQGNLKVNSAVGQGTEFIVHLPVTSE